MFCPNCGAQAAENTKFCRQCGLPLNRLAEYVASGGTAPLDPPPPLEKTALGLTPKQKLVLTIMLFVFAPGLFGFLGTLIGWEQLAAIPGMLMPLGIVWAVFRYKNQMRRLRYQELQQTLEQAQQRFQPQSYQPPLQAPPTNPFAGQPAESITEDETKQLPEQRSKM
jgi:zinc ribbon protein